MTSRGHSFVKGLGFLGRAWAAGRPALADLTTDSEFGRSAAAQSAGLQTGLAFPLQCGGRTLKGVLLRSEAEPANTPMVEQARMRSWLPCAYGTYVREQAGKAESKERICR